MQYIRQVQMHFTFDHNFCLIPALKVMVPPEEHTTLVSTTLKAWKAFKYLFYFSEIFLYRSTWTFEYKGSCPLCPKLEQASNCGVLGKKEQCPTATLQAHC